MQELLGTIERLKRDVGKLKESNNELKAAREAGDTNIELRDAIGVSLSTRPGMCKHEALIPFMDVMCKRLDSQKISWSAAGFGPSKLYY